MKSVMKGAKKIRFDQYDDHCIVLNFRFHHDSHSQILTATETSSAPTLTRSNLFNFHLFIDRNDLSYLLYQYCRVTFLKIIQFHCILWIGIGENYVV